jgi:hypothetical protein
VVRELTFTYRLETESVSSCIERAALVLLCIKSTFILKPHNLRTRTITSNDFDLRTSGPESKEISTSAVITSFELALADRRDSLDTGRQLGARLVVLLFPEN